MNLELIPFLAALIGSSIAAIYDFKTTEVPDEIPLTMILIAISFYTFQTISTQNFIFLRDSLIAGLSLLTFGLLMYFFGQWGGADALILSSIGFLLPFAPSFFKKTFLPFPLTYLINSFFVGAAYMLIYALIFSIRRKRIIKNFLSQLKAGAQLIPFFSAILFIFVFSLALITLKFYFLSLIFSLFTVAITILFYVTIKFAKCVEEFGFRKKIPVSKLKVGDVLLEFKQFRGIKKEEIMRIKKSGKKYVWIKFGVPYALTFPLTLIFTLFFGDFIFLIKALI
jgi:Flp pilus assembly protein protease CpaA